MKHAVKKDLFSRKVAVFKLHYDNLGLINLSSYLLQRVFKPANGIIKIKLKNISQPLYVRNVASDTQIFLRNELAIASGKSPSIIIDAGAKIGMATVYLKNRYPSAWIFCVEPDDANFKMLVKNTSAYAGIRCYNKGLWNKKVWLTIINQEAGNESFIVQETEQSIPGALEAITIDEIVHQNEIREIDLLKIDIEGSEAKVFERNYESWLGITSNMLVEIHNWIDMDAEKIVLAAVKQDFSKEMAGEHHFFKRRSV